DEINLKLADYQSYDYDDYLEQERHVQINVNLAKYITNKETKASAPKNLIRKLLIDSELVYPPKYTKENHNKLIVELKKALNYHFNKKSTRKDGSDPSDYFKITTK
ncbi:hypothetical protein E4271_11555, partial [Staphylococcus pseudintermedius]|nr:hypothetical protein [Staphylococcus pseudintermedius]